MQQLRNVVVAPTSMGENYRRIMPLLRQGCLVTEKCMALRYFVAMHADNITKLT